MITIAHFIERMGVKPIQDDLERCNCAQAGQIGHWQCGWDTEFDLPVFLVGRSDEQREYFRLALWPQYQPTT